MGFLIYLLAIPVAFLYTSVTFTLTDFGIKSETKFKVVFTIVFFVYYILIASLMIYEEKETKNRQKEDYDVQLINITKDENIITISNVIGTAICTDYT